jgi:aminopeptidase-like protein
VLEENKYYRNTNPKGEPQLGRRGLYGIFGGKKDAKLTEMAILWVLNFADGQHSLLDIAEQADLNFDQINQAAQVLLQHGLLTEFHKTYAAPSDSPERALL